MRKTKSLDAQLASPPTPSLPVGDALAPGTDSEALLGALPWGVVVLDAHGTVRHLNQRAAHWWGAPPQALRG